jgi:hypothetical protein
MYNVYIPVVGKFSIKRVYNILNSCTFFIHMMDMYLTIQVQYNTGIPEKVYMYYKTICVQ